MKVGGNLIQIVCLVTTTLGAVSSLEAESWSAQPIEVHEWGVNGYDWSVKGQLKPTFPPHIYTPEKPGKPLVHPVVKERGKVMASRVKDLAPDSGIRYKPVLYFYPPSYSYEAAVDGKIVKKKAYRSGSIPVALEMRFRYGDVCAWYPQVSKFRPPSVTERAKSVDWKGWREKNGLKENPQLPGKGFYGSQVEYVDKKTGDIKVKKLVIPDDERFELVWDRLTLRSSQPDDLNTRLGLGGEKREPVPTDFAGVDLPDTHWTKIARDVDAGVLSNGKEAEKYLFYEGVTREQPAIAVVRNGKLLVNVSRHTLYDVYLIYNKDGKKYVKYQPSLPPLPGKFMARLYVTPFPMVSIPDWRLEHPLDDEEFKKATSHRILDNMTQGNEFDYPNQRRDPGDPQGDTMTHRLYPKEASVVEKIWRNSFFNKEGLTILYRESPAYLDESMPLNIYTDMYHFIKLNRCGWVVNHNVDIDRVRSVGYKVGAIHADDIDAKSRAELLAYLKNNKHYARGILKFQNWVFNHAKSRELLVELK